MQQIREVIFYEGGPPAGLTQAQVDTIIKLADEGLPVAAIARTYGKPSEDIRLVLEEAKDAGKIVSVPRPDWAPATTRSERGVEPVSAFGGEDTILSVMRAFGLSGGEAAVFGALLRRDYGTKGQLHNASKRDNPDKDTEPKIVDVYICKIRKKLERLGLGREIVIETMWGKGYCLSRATKSNVLKRLRG